MESVTELGWTVAREVAVITERVVKSLALMPLKAFKRVWNGRA
jgi:hypothetical protein